jgi:hypothetical protein
VLNKKIARNEQGSSAKLSWRGGTMVLILVSIYSILMTMHHLTMTDSLLGKTSNHLNMTSNPPAVLDSSGRAELKKASDLNKGPAVATTGALPTKITNNVSDLSAPHAIEALQSLDSATKQGQYNVSYSTKEHGKLLTFSIVMLLMPIVHGFNHFASLTHQMMGGARTVNRRMLNPINTHWLLKEISLQTLPGP